jgi:hypothetical protein
VVVSFFFEDEIFLVDCALMNNKTETNKKGNSLTCGVSAGYPPRTDWLIPTALP